MIPGIHTHTKAQTKHNAQRTTHNAQSTKHKAQSTKYKAQSTRPIALRCEQKIEAKHQAEFSKELVDLLAKTDSDYDDDSSDVLDILDLCEVRLADHML